MLKRLSKVLASISATAVVVIAVLTIATIVEQRYSSRIDLSSANADIYVIHDDSGAPITCYREGNRIALTTDDNGEIIGNRPITAQADMQRCIEVFKSGNLPFDPRNYIGRYEAGYISWEGTDFTNIHDWDLPNECESHYQFKEKSHPRIVDALGLVDTIEVTFAWTGTDSEWNTCFAARQQQIAEIDPSEFEIEIPENSHQTAVNDDSNEHLKTVAEPRPERDVETVMLNPSITNRVTSHLSWYSADIIRNGVLIKEDFVRPGDALILDTLDTASFRSLPTDGDQCATKLQLYEDELDEIAEQRSGWQLTYLLIVDEDTATLHRCSIPRIESAN